MHSLKAIAVLLFLFTGTLQAQTPYENVKNILIQTAKTYPQTTKLLNVGASDSGDTVLGIAIGSGPVHHLVVATHHGNEYGSTAVATYFATTLAKQPLEGMTVFVVPVLNINGYNNNTRNEHDHNGNSLDPNRDYPGPCSTSGPFFLKSTTGLAKFIEQQNIVASATLHTFYPAVVYPWGLNTEDTTTPYDDIFLTLVKAATVESQYEVGNSTKVIYPADGTFEDYAFWKLGIWSILFEIGNSHNPTTNDIQKIVAENSPGLARMLSIAPKTRAPNHAFTGKCTGRKVDLHLE
jgi:carboxypeptidase T